MQVPDINYIGILEYLDKNQGIPYSKPEAVTRSSEERKRLINIRSKGQRVKKEIIKIGERCLEKFNLNIYDEVKFHPNRSENRLIKSTLFKLQKLTTSAENSKVIRQLLVAFELVEPSTNHLKDFSQVKMDRSMKNYDLLLQWSKIFLMNKSFSTFFGKDQSKALLFPMEKVYENYVTQHLKREFGSKGWEVNTQEKGHYLFNESSPKFSIKPDIVCKKENRIIIMDTKWKNLISNESKNYGILQSDMYQMYAYSKKYNTSEIWLLYPLNDEMRGHPEIIFKSEDNTTVRLHFIDLANIQESLDKLRKDIEGEQN